MLVKDELFASRSSTAQPNHRPIQVLVETPLVVVSEKSFRFSKELLGLGTLFCVNHPSQFPACRPQRLPHRYVPLTNGHRSSCIHHRIPCNFEVSC